MLPSFIKDLQLREYKTCFTFIFSSVDVSGYKDLYVSPCASSLTLQAVPDNFCVFSSWLLDKICITVFCIAPGHSWCFRSNGNWLTAAFGGVFQILQFYFHSFIELCKHRFSFKFLISDKLRKKYKKLNRCILWSPSTCIPAPLKWKTKPNKEHWGFPAFFFCSESRNCDACRNANFPLQLEYEQHHFPKKLYVHFENISEVHYFTGT